MASEDPGAVQVQRGIPETDALIQKRDLIEEEIQVVTRSKHLQEWRDSKNAYIAHLASVGRRQRNLRRSSKTVRSSCTYGRQTVRRSNAPADNFQTSRYCARQRNTGPTIHGIFAYPSSLPFLYGPSSPERLRRSLVCAETPPP